MTKLYYSGTLDNGTIRLQSQLHLGRDTANYIFKNNQLYVWGRGDKGFDFYPTNEPFEIIYPEKEV